MDRDRRLKAMTQFSNVCGFYPVNKQIIFFGVHDIQFDDFALMHMERQNIQPFILKSGDSVNDQRNNNGPNAKLKSLYNEVKSAWMLKYGTTKMSPHYMNYILV